MLVENWIWFVFSLNLDFDKNHYHIAVISFCTPFSEKKNKTPSLSPLCFQIIYLKKVIEWINQHVTTEVTQWMSWIVHTSLGMVMTLLKITKVSCLVCMFFVIIFYYFVIKLSLRVFDLHHNLSICLSQYLNSFT